MLGAEQAALEQHGLQELLRILEREFEYYKGAYQSVATQVSYSRPICPRILAYALALSATLRASA